MESLTDWIRIIATSPYQIKARILEIKTNYCYKVTIADKIISMEFPLLVSSTCSVLSAQYCIHFLLTMFVSLTDYVPCLFLADRLPNFAHDIKEFCRCNAAISVAVNRMKGLAIIWEDRNKRSVFPIVHCRAQIKSAIFNQFARRSHNLNEQVLGKFDVVDFRVLECIRSMHFLLNSNAEQSMFFAISKYHFDCHTSTIIFLPQNFEHWLSSLIIVTIILCFHNNIFH